MVTIEPTGACVSAAGSWSRTTPSALGSVVSSSNVSTLKPAARSCWAAVASSCEVTSGTVRCGFGLGPSETLMRTFVPVFRVASGFGYCATTWSNGRFACTYATAQRRPARRRAWRAWVWVWPTTSGTLTVRDGGRAVVVAGVVVVAAVTVVATVVVATVVTGVVLVVVRAVVVAARATLIRTLLPLTTCSPAFGSWATTVPAGSADATRDAFATSPARRSVATAADCEEPRTFGTATLSRPFDTVSVTTDPFTTLEPAAGDSPSTVSLGFWEKTVFVCGRRPALDKVGTPFVAVRPTTSGTRTVAGARLPAETINVTLLPRASDVPGAGRSSITVPAVRELARRSTTACSPARSTAATASACARPRTSGTRTDWGTTTVLVL